MHDHYAYTIFICRIQPPHKAHIEIIAKALDIATEKVLLVLGSHGAAPDIRNPWSAEQRAEMVRACFLPDQADRIEFLPVRDHYYNDEVWLAEVQQKVKAATRDSSAPIAYIGHRKDNTSYYLEMFPQWQFIDSGLFVKSALAATMVRESYFAKRDSWKTYLNPEIIIWLERYKKTDQYENLCREFSFITEYRTRWANTPFPVTFTTVDAVVTKAGHVLLVRRGINPGKGLLALPGGFLEQSERLEYAVMRELEEETKIKIPFRDLKRYIVESRPFDYPERSLRGRTITYAFHFKLPEGGDLPNVKGADDAKEAIWMPIGELALHEHEFHEDHLHIINFFVNRW